MKRVFIKYIAIAVALLATAMTAQAQYHSEGGVSTAKNVSGPDDDGFYTITLESFATGTTTVTENSTPVDVVLVLDISGSMVQPKGSTTNVPNGTNISYNTVKNSDICYFFRDGDGDYDQIYCEEYNGRYYLYYNYGAGKTYIYNDRWGDATTSSNRPNNAPTDANSTIFTTEVNYWGTANTVTGSIARIDALKEAVNAFIAEIDHNDAYDSNDNPRPDEDGDGNPDRIGNRISIVTFSNNANTRHGLTPVEGNVSTLQSTVNSFVPAGGTNAAAGMTNANTVLNSANASSNRVVIMFTDGEPNSNTHSTVISNAKTIKDRGVLVFTIGVFTNTPDTGGQIWRYMNYVSSNYPNATSINNAGQGGNSEAGYYKDASTSEADLTSIFVSIAQGIGGSTEEIGATTQVRDVVSNSFVIPDGTTASDVKVYTANALTETTWGTRVAYNATITFVDANGNKITPKADGSVAGAKSIYVEGFDFSKDDTSEGAGDGNWVGQRFNQSHNPQYFWAGKKLIIELKIKANGEATGGTGTATNESTSGVYIKNEDGTYTPINHYDVPHTTLTTTIKIKKTGLRIGESATFEIMKIRPKGWDESKTLEENVANIEYNIIGKPLPNSQEYTGTEELTGSDLYKKMGWSSFSKVVLTNKSETNGGEVVKILRALDPYWVYMVLEDDWGWAYDMSGNNAVDPTTGEPTTSMVELNPFSFHNTEKADVPKHAEAVTINHFGYTISGGAFDGKQEEHYKSSKVKSF